MIVGGCDLINSPGEGVGGGNGWCVSQAAADALSERSGRGQTASCEQVSPTEHCCHGFQSVSDIFCGFVFDFYHFIFSEEIQ